MSFNGDLSLDRALGNLRVAQERMGCFPACWVDINGYGFPLGAIPDPKNTLKCSLPKQLLVDILSRKVHWNNAEIGCLIRFDRTGPYLPDVHMLLSFFHLPRT